MKKFLKITGIIVLTASLIFGAMIAAVIIMFPPEKVKSIILTELTEMTGRKITIEELNINIFKGIEIKDFVMYEADSKAKFIEDKEMLLKYSIAAILKGTLLINDLQLNEPNVIVMKTDNGIFNYTDIITTINESLKSGKKVKKDRKAFPIIVTRLSLKNGTVIYSDITKAKPLKVTVDKLNFQSENMLVSALKAVDLKGSCVVTYEKIKLPVELLTTVAIDVLKGDVKLNVKKLSLPGITSLGETTVKGWKTIKGSLTSSIDTDILIKSLPAEYSEKMKVVKTNVIISNRVNYQLKDRVLTFTDIISPVSGIVAYNDRPIAEKLGGNITITEKYDMKGSLSLNLTGSPVTIAMSGEKINKISEAVIRADIKSPKFALEYLLGLFPKKDISKQVTETEKKEKLAKTKQNIEKLKKTSMPGLYINLNADSVTLKDITLGKTIASIRMQAGKLYSESAISAYKGNITSSITADIKKESYTANVKITNVTLDKFVTDAIAVMPKKDQKKKSLLDELSGKVSGSLNLKSDLTGASFTDIAHTIKGSGNFIVSNGVLTSIDTAKDIAKKTGLSFLNEDLTFDIMASDFNMAKGRIDINNFRMQSGPDGNSGDIKVKGSGYVTVDKALDLKMLTDINPVTAKEIESSLARNLGITDASYGYSKDGWMPFDFRVYGTLMEKKYDYSQPRLLDNVKRNLTKKVQEQGTKFLKTEGEKLINKLFGK